IQVDETSWVNIFRKIQSQAELAQLPDAKLWEMERFAHWSSTPTLSAGSRGAGFGVPRWVLRDGAVVHIPGHSEDYLVFHTPLVGNFEVACALKLPATQAIHVRYGAYEFELSADRMHYKLHNALRRTDSETLILPPLPATTTDAYQFRL